MCFVNQNLSDNQNQKKIVIYLLTAGFFSIFGQVVVLRELAVAFFGVELIYVLSFAFWLIGTAIGAAFGKRGYIPSEKNIAILLLFSSVLLISELVFIRGIRNLFGGVKGGYLPFLEQLTALLLALLPIGFLSGILFQWIAKRFIELEGNLPAAYAIESAGGIIGGLCSTILLDYGISNYSMALGCSALISVTITVFAVTSNQRILKFFSSAISTAFFILFFYSNKTDMWLTSWNHPNLVESADSPYNRVTISSLETQISVFEDDILSFETQSTSAEEFVQLSLLLTENTKNILVLGGGFGGIIDELLKFQTEKIDYVEINKNLIAILKRRFPPDHLNFIRSNRVNIIYDDARKYLNRHHFYDVILVGMPEPTSAQINRFYTKEFFKQCFNSLSEEGIIAFKLQSSENIWTPQLTERNASIFNALKNSFKHFIIFPGVINIFVGSKIDLVSEPSALIQRFNRRNINTKLITPQYIKYILTNDRFMQVQQLLASKPNPINSDLHPVSYSYTLSIWLSKFFPNLTFSQNPLHIARLNSSYLISAALLLIFFAVVVRKFYKLKRFLIVLAAGFVGMILEIILILLYQNKNGILFRDIGILLMMFMTGLSVGAFAVSKLLSASSEKKPRKLNLIIILESGLVLLSLIVYLLIQFELLYGLILISITLMIAGFFVAGIFSYFSLANVKNQQAVVSQLYAADLIGGCLGALLGSLILIPIFGFFLTLIFLALISFLCITLCL